MERRGIKLPIKLTPNPTINPTIITGNNNENL